MIDAQEYITDKMTPQERPIISTEEVSSEVVEEIGGSN
jgi:hypothetical protein